MEKDARPASGLRAAVPVPMNVETDMTAEHLSDAVPRERALLRHPLGRLGTAADVAAVVGFLCSAEAAFVTGQSLNVSGGFVV
jgi:2-hydroxycyclohexanecarboxyl-CoA dehydrogenase